MNERLLCRCQNSFVADNVTEVLEANGIASRRHDETNDCRTGAYGPTPGIAIYVFEDNFEKALSLVEPVLNHNTDNTKSFCPKCGSEDITRIERSKYATPLLILSIFLFIAPCVYFYCTMGAENKSAAMDSLAIAVFIISIIIMITCERKNANFRCRHCGRKFNHIL